MILRSTHAITLLLILLSGTLTLPSSSIDSEIFITPDSTSTIVKNVLLDLPYPNYDNYAPPLLLKSDIPVSLLRYAHSSMTTGNNVIEENELRVYVTTNCQQPQHYKIFFRKQKDDDGYVKVLKIIVRRQNDDVASPSTMVDFLPASSFVASWNYTSIWCEAGVPFGNRKLETKYIRHGSSDNIRKDDDRRHLTATGNNIFNDNASGSGGSSSSSPPYSSSSCTFMAEILYDGCQRDVQVKAPIIKINNVTLKKITESETEEECKTHYDAKLKGESISLMQENDDNDDDNGSNNDNYISTGQLSGARCRVVAEGRPFVDAEGRQLQAEVNNTKEEACWSETDTTTTPPETDITINPPPLSSSARHLASDWTQRALGEHASIASFASFTISLLTNNAPPALIRDALRAALDEVNHATVSFDMASLLSQQIIEPGALPPSSLHFDLDLERLLKGTFEEGCIDETMSALKAAVESDRYGACDDDDEEGGMNCDTQRLLRDRLRRIALDEARHAALAWRTIRWGCGVDEESCRRAVEPYVSSSSGDQMWEKIIESRSSGSVSLSEEVQRAGERIHRVLLPLVMTTGSSNRVGNSGMDCSNHDITFISRGGDFVEEVADRIIYEMVCGSSRDSASSSARSTY